MAQDLIERRWVRWLALWGAAFVLALLLDRRVHGWLLEPGLADEDWVEALRQMGYLPTWLVVGLLIWLHDQRTRGPMMTGVMPGVLPGVMARLPGRPPHHRAGLVVLSAVSAGLAANVLKPVIGRLRPDAEGVTAWAARPTVIVADGGDLGLGLPSGHTAVAFGGCWMVALLWPAWRWPMLALAAGCALTRLWAGAHALSDTVMAAGAATGIAWVLYVAGEGPRRGHAGGLVPGPM